MSLPDIDRQSLMQLTSHPGVRLLMQELRLVLDNEMSVADMTTIRAINEAINIAGNNIARNSYVHVQTITTAIDTLKRNLELAQAMRRSTDINMHALASAHENNSWRDFIHTLGRGIPILYENHLLLREAIQQNPNTANNQEIAGRISIFEEALNAIPAVTNAAGGLTTQEARFTREQQLARAHRCHQELVEAVRHAEPDANAEVRAIAEANERTWSQIVSVVKVVAGVTLVAGVIAGAAALTVASGGTATVAMTIGPFVVFSVLFQRKN
ncbi:unnamed protein product [Adineta steineri]|uniref:Uncharacterized protein n=1 Tax=Adineta steineri TaxID=433720 RepID=A0A818M3I4_9BILA|nr:unnamed protein product [Adineta steineri]CAF3578670.1 unnamed protein product [Adineta steineri]